MGKSLREPLRAEDHYALESLLKRIAELQPMVSRGGRIYSRTVGFTSKLAGYFSGAASEIRELLAADRDAERKRTADQATKEQIAET